VTLRQVLTNYLALWWVEVGQPCTRRYITTYVQYKLHKIHSVCTCISLFRNALCLHFYLGNLNYQPLFQQYVHYHINKSLPPVSTLCQLKLEHIILFYLFKIHIILSFHLHLGLPSSPFQFSPPKLCMLFSSYSSEPKAQLHIDRITSVISGKHI